MEKKMIGVEQYRDLVRICKKEPHKIFEVLNENTIDLMHMALGLASEVGELVDCIKKAVIYEQKLDRANLIEELGDIEFYLEGLRQRVNVEREHTLAKNIEKLSTRYPCGVYTDFDAKQRADKSQQTQINFGE
jgi:NTP pyrophosphatase (non-canonical NTP hydrolase)